MSNPTAQSDSILKGEMPRAITIAIVAMGGEGGGVLADWIVDTAEHDGYRAQTTSVPGVAQRTGATIYYLEIFPEAALYTAGREPVLALMPVPGEVDVVLASELMEAGRAVQRGLVTPGRTTLIASTNRVSSMTEKTAIADGQVDAGKLLEICSQAAKRFVRGDFAKLAEQKRSAISAVLLGALAGSAALPFDRDEFEAAIRRSGVGVESSLAAFAAGFDDALHPATDEASVASPKRKVGVRLQKLAARIAGSFPLQSHDVLLAGLERLVDFQDENYAVEYLDRLDPIREQDTQFGNGHFVLLRETGRYLALWMSYEDASRVADLKIRRTRFERVQQESQASAAQLVQISEFLHPRLEELADVMPDRWGRWLLRTDWARRAVERMTRKGMVLQTTSLWGFLQLYMISGLRRWRRKSMRFQEERRRIDAWLKMVTSLAPEDYSAVLEIAEFPRVVKGYGDTHIQGRKKFDLMMEALNDLRGKPGIAGYLKELREAALADENGQKLAEVLAEVERRATTVDQLSAPHEWSVRNAPIKTVCLGGGPALPAKR